MAARPAITNVSLSTFSQPMVGQKNKTITIQGPYNGQQGSAGNNDATSDVISVSADYGVYDTTTSSNVDVNSTNLKDPA